MAPRTSAPSPALPTPLPPPALPLAEPAEGDSSAHFVAASSSSSISRPLTLLWGRREDKGRSGSRACVDVYIDIHVYMYTYIYTNRCEGRSESRA
jgi:hypothetical protein